MFNLEETLHAVSRENAAAHGELDSADVDRVGPNGAFLDLTDRIARLRAQLAEADADQHHICGIIAECGKRVTQCPSDGVRQMANELLEARAELFRLRALINTPRTDEFFDVVRIEAAHQIERWGVEHDAGKRPEDWITLYMYLLGKAAKAHFDGDHEKLLHHIITVAAVALNWHRNATGVSTLMRPGVGPEVP